MSETLTGRRRFRSKRKWGRETLILQVEVNRSQYDWDYGYGRTSKWTEWRDATTKDLTVEEVTA